MAMDAGTLLISIETNTADIKAEMDAVKASVNAAMKDVQQYVGLAKEAFLAFGGVASIAAFRSIVEGAIESKAKLYDMSLQTGISVEALSALGRIAKMSNTDLTDVAGASNKLSKALFTQNEDSKGAASAIKALGLSYNDFKGLQADEQMLRVAKAMDGFQDGTGKSATAMLLFGKTGATLLPFLHELAEATSLVGKQTTESAKQAKDYEDNIKKMKGAGEAWRREATEYILPALLDITNQLNDGKKAYGSYAAAMWDALRGSTVQGDLVSTREKMEGVRKELERMAIVSASGGFADTRGSRGTQAAADSVRKDLEAQLELLGKRKAFQEAQQAREALMGSGAVLDKFDRPKPILKPDGGGVTKDVNDAYNQLIKMINEKVAINKAEYESEVALTEVQKLRVKINQDIETGLIKLTTTQKAAIAQDLAGAQAWEKLNLQKQADLKWFKEATDANAVYIESQMLLRTQVQGQTRDAQLQLAQYGLTADELKSLEAARLRDAAAALERRAVLATDVDLTGQLAGLYREQASALRDNAAARDALAAKEARDREDPIAGTDRAVKEYLADVKRAGDATYGAVSNSLKGLEDLGVTALSGGRTKDAAKQLVSGIISEFERLYIIKPLMASIFGGAAGGGGSSTNWVGSLIGSIGSLFGGGYSANGGVGYANAAGISGGRAGGGSVDAGKSYLVGEKGPEVLRMGSTSGTVIPNDQVSGSSLHLDFSGQTINVGQGVSRGEVAAALQQSNAQTEQRIRRLMRNGNL